MIEVPPSKASKPRVLNKKQVNFNSNPRKERRDVFPTPIASEDEDWDEPDGRKKKQPEIVEKEDGVISSEIAEDEIAEHQTQSLQPVPRGFGRLSTSNSLNKVNNKRRVNFSGRDEEIGDVSSISDISSIQSLTDLIVAVLKTKFGNDSINGITNSNYSRINRVLELRI